MIRALHPKGCTCNTCQDGDTRPIDQASELELRSAVEGRLRNKSRAVIVPVISYRVDYEDEGIDSSDVEEVNDSDDSDNVDMTENDALKQSSVD